jgi:hypothetical protein
MTEIAISGDITLEAIPNRPAVFLLWPRTGKPYLARTNVLHRRLTRLLGSLRGAAERIEYQFTGSKLEAQFLVLDLARAHLGAAYRQAIRLRLPPYVKLVLSNQFPRTQRSRRLLRSFSQSRFGGAF